MRRRLVVRLRKRRKDITHEEEHADMERRIQRLEERARLVKRRWELRQNA